MSKETDNETIKAKLNGADGYRDLYNFIFSQETEVFLRFTFKYLIEFPGTRNKGEKMCISEVGELEGKKNDNAIKSASGVYGQNVS